MASSSSKDDEQAEEDGRGLGVIFADDTKKLDIFEVWDENWDTVMMFCRMQTQWRTTMAGYQGLDYNVLKWFLDLYAVNDQVAMLEGLQVMEMAALEELNNGGIS